MIFTARMGVPEALPPAFHPCTKNKQHLSVFPSLQGLWWGLDIPELLLYHLARYCCSEAMVGWSPRYYPAPLQSWHTLDRGVLRRAGEILSAETQPRDVPDWLIWVHLFWQVIWTSSLSCFVSTCKEYVVNLMHVISSLIWMHLTCFWCSNSQVSHLFFTHARTPVCLIVSQIRLIWGLLLSKCLMSQMQRCSPQDMWKTAL